MGKACTCCDQKICNCRRIMKSLDFSFADFKTTFEINKDIFDVNCYMYFYVGDATGYYKQDGTRVPYKKYLVEISLDPQDDTQQFTGAFKINKQCPLNIRINATTKFYIQNNKYYIEFPDERFVKNFLNTEVCLVYDKKQFFLRLNVPGGGFQWNPNNPFNIPDFQEQLKNSGIEEFKNCIVNFFVTNLPANEPSLNIIWETDMRCPFRFLGANLYHSSDCTFPQSCFGAPLGQIKTSWRRAEEITPAFDYGDSLGIYKRVWHGFFVEILYSNTFQEDPAKFTVQDFPNYIDTFTENLNRTKFVNGKREVRAVSKTCAGPCDSSGCSNVIFTCGLSGRDYICETGPGGGSLPWCNNKASRTEAYDMDGGQLSCIDVTCNCPPNGGFPSGPAGCICDGGGLGAKPRTCYASKSSDIAIGIQHGWAACSYQKQICNSFDDCCCSQYPIFNDTYYGLGVQYGSGAGYWEFIFTGYPYGGFTSQNNVIRPENQKCWIKFNQTATTTLKLEKKDRCYSSDPSRLMRSIFRLTDNQSTPQIEGCDFVRGQYRAKIFEDASNQFRSPYRVTRQQFQNGTFYHEVPPLSCFEYLDVNNGTREYFKADTEINSKIPFYIDEFNNLILAISPDRLKGSVYIPGTCVDSGNPFVPGDIAIFPEIGATTSETCFNDNIAVVITDEPDLAKRNIELYSFLFVLTPVYKADPPIDSYFIMTCFIRISNKFISSDFISRSIFSSEPVIVRFPQDLYQDLTFNVAPNITWTINLLGTWRG